MTQIVREVSKRLQDKIDQANSLFGKGKELVMEAYKIATEENGFSPQEAKQLLLDKITVFKKSTIYSYLPDEAKDKKAQELGRTPKFTKETNVPKLEQQSEKTTTYKGDAGNDPELVEKYTEEGATAQWAKQAQQEVKLDVKKWWPVIEAHMPTKTLILVVEDGEVVDVRGSA